MSPGVSGRSRSPDLGRHPGARFAIVGKDRKWVWADATTGNRSRHNCDGLGRTTYDGGIAKGVVDELVARQDELRRGVWILTVESQTSMKNLGRASEVFCPLARLNSSGIMSFAIAVTIPSCPALASDQSGSRHADVKLSRPG